MGSTSEITDQVDCNGHRLSANTEASGRFHTDWLNMIYPRLKLARGLLREDGVIFISIDNNELGNLIAACHEVFGEENYIGTLVWKGATDNNPTQIVIEHEYVLCFAKAKASAESVWKNSSDDSKQILLEQYHFLKSNPLLSEDQIQKDIRTFIRSHRDALAAVTHYDRVDSNGLFTGSRKVHNPKPGGYKYDVIHPATRKVCTPPVNGYRYPKERMDELIATDRIIYGDDENQIIQIKEYLSDYQGKLPSVIHLDSRTGSNELNSLFGVQKVFTNPKPVQLIEGLFDFVVKPGELVLDFFAGSGTTAHAVMNLNAKDQGGRRTILVQLPEQLSLEDKDQAIAASYCDKLKVPRTLAELTKERLRRCASKIRSEHGNAQGDLGFRVFKLDSSNIRAWDPDREYLSQTLLNSAEHIKAGRTEQDILFELLIKLGLDLTVPIEEKSIGGKAMHSIGAGSLFVCLAPRIAREDVEALALGIVAWHEELAPLAKRRSSSATAPSPTTWPRRTSPPSSSRTGWKTSAACEEESHETALRTQPRLPARRDRVGLRPVSRTGNLPHRVHRHARASVVRQQRLAGLTRATSASATACSSSTTRFWPTSTTSSSATACGRPTSLASGDFTVEMETGTGKTYVYLRTIFELNKRFGFTKFVIVVPSVAIKEGVYKTLQITEEHFRGLYANTPFEYFLYDSGKLGQVRNFATSPNIQIMVVTVGAINKKDVNNLYKDSEKTGGEKPIDLIQATRPIVIVDEPQSVDGGLEGRGKEALGAMNPLCTLRYSATHVDKHHMVFRLDAVDAYERKLVKQIEVASAGVEGDHNKPYVRLVSVEQPGEPHHGQGRAGRSATAGVGREERPCRSDGDDLEQVTGRAIYADCRIGEISLSARADEFLELEVPGGEHCLQLGQAIGGVDDDATQAPDDPPDDQGAPGQGNAARAPGHQGAQPLLHRRGRALPHATTRTAHPRRAKYAVIFEEEYRAAWPSIRTTRACSRKWT